MCIALVLIMVASLAACGGSKAEKLATKDGAYYFGSDEGKKKLEESFNPLNPVNVMSNMTFDARMLHGRFVMPDEEKAVKEYAKTATFEELEFSETYATQTAEENKRTIISIFDVFKLD